MTREKKRGEEKRKESRARKDVRKGDKAKWKKPRNWEEKVEM